MQDWPRLGRDAPDVMEKGAWDYGYQLAAEYFPGLDRETFYTFAAGYTLAIEEWESIVGTGEPRREDVDRFYRQGCGLLFNILRHPRPPGVWGADQHRGHLTQQCLDAAGAMSIIDFGGGVGAMAMQLARWGYQVGYLDVGETARFGKWWIKREGLDAPWHPRLGKVSAYLDLTNAELDVAFTGYQWQAISALDVLEHVWEPVDLLRAFDKALAPGGVLVLTRHSFKEHPTHLARTFWLFEELDRVLAEIGFIPLTAPDGHYGIGSWRKEGELLPLAGPG